MWDKLYQVFPKKNIRTINSSIENPPKTTLTRHFPSKPLPIYIGVMSQTLVKPIYLPKMKQGIAYFWRRVVFMGGGQIPAGEATKAGNL